MSDTQQVRRTARVLFFGGLAAGLAGMLIVSCSGGRTGATFVPTQNSEPVSASEPEQSARVDQPITIVDRAGEELGDGEVRLYAPESVGLGKTIEVRLEIEVKDADPSVFNPPPSPTPALGTPRPTPSPLPLNEIQFIEVRQFMGARLGGLNARFFEIVPVPPDGIREMQANAINWWKWNVSAVDEQAVGENQLEVVIYLPNILDDGTPFNEETNILAFNLTVIPPPTATPSPTTTPTPTPTFTPTPSVVERVTTAANSVEGVLALIVGIATLISLSYGGYRFLAERRQKKAEESRGKK